MSKSEEVRVSDKPETGNMVCVAGAKPTCDKVMEDNCLGVTVNELNDISLGETIFCRQIDAGKYLDQLDAFTVEEINETTTATNAMQEEVEIPKAKGAYVLGKIQGMGCVFTVDTACTKTIVSKQMYYRIPKGKRPKLDGRGSLAQAGKDAPPVEVLGKGIFTLQLGPLKVKPRLLIVADISDQILLGDNLLREDPALGPGDLMYSEKVLRLGGKRIPLRMVSTPERALRVVSIDDEIIPAMSEKLVDGFIQRPETDIQGENSMLVETSVAFRDRFGCLLTPVVVNTEGKVSTCVRVLNPFPQPILIPGEVTMGHLEPVEVLRVVQEQENEGESQNFGHCRRIVFTPNECKETGYEKVTNARHPCVSAEFRAGARRAPKRRRMNENDKRSSQEGAEAGPRTERIKLCASQNGAEAGPRTEIINQSASQVWADAGPRTERIKGDASCRAEAGPRTEIINGISSPGLDMGQQRTMINDETSQVTEAARRMTGKQDDADPQGGDDQATEPKKPTEGSASESQVKETVGRDEIPPHMKDFIERSIKGWSKSQQEAIQKMLLQFQDVFSKDELDIGQTHLMEAEIDTGDARPVRTRPRPMAKSMEEEGRKTIERMEERDLIRPSKSPWASNVTLVRKPNGKIRITIDYRGLNSVTQIPVSNQPRTQDCIDALANARYFSIGDSSAAYHQIRMKEEDIPKTAFITKFGLYEWTVLPMGLSGAPFCYTRLMELALSGLQWNTCVIYLDDVIVFGKTFEEHLQRLAEVLTRFRSARLKLKPEKCHFFQEEVKFLGYLISAEGVRPHPDNIKKIVDWPTPKTQTDVRAILGMGNYYRRFIRGYSQKVSPLVELTKQDVPFRWDKKCQDTFEQLKKELVGCDIVAHPQDEGQFILDTDASASTIGVYCHKYKMVQRRLSHMAAEHLAKQKETTV